GDSGQITRATIDTPATHFGGEFGLPLTLGRVETLSDGIGGVDRITTGDGSNVIFGGAAGDAIIAGNGTNLVFGDGGFIDWSSDGSVIDHAVSTNPAIGGNDTIMLGNGANPVTGGADDATVTAGTGSIVILGPSGTVH